MIKKYIVLLILWELFFRGFELNRELLDFSLEYLPKIKVPNSIWSKFLAASGDKIGLGCAVGFSLHFMERYKSLIIITAFTFGSALNVTMKMFYHEVRPYMLSENVVPSKCKM